LLVQKQASQNHYDLGSQRWRQQLRRSIRRNWYGGECHGRRRADLHPLAHAVMEQQS
jgi:hypothetical protein